MNIRRDSEISRKLAQPRHQVTFARDDKGRVRDSGAHPCGRAQKHLMVLYRVVQVSDDGYKAAFVRQTEPAERRGARELAVNFHSLEVETVVMLDDSLRLDTFANQ